MKIRVGIGLGVRTTLNDEGFLDVVDALEELHYDSLWLSERIGGEAPDPIVAMSVAAARTKKLKFGTSVMVLPGRNPILLAKELATLDRMSKGRVLPAFGLGAVDPHEQQAFGVVREERAKRFDEALRVMRACWTEDSVTHHGTYFHYDDVRVLPKPIQQPIDVWFGGIAPSELRRVGRLADGWLPSFVTPADVEVGKREVERIAAEHERTIDPEHFGALIPYAHGPLPDALKGALQARRPDLDDVGQLVPQGWSALVEMIERFVAVGFSKFVVLPIVEPNGSRAWVDHLAEAAPHLMPLQT